MTALRRLAEAGALLIAIALLVPVIPSNDGYVHEFGLLHGLAIASFAISRTIRWSRHYWLALPETIGFAVIVLILLMAYNLL